MLYDQFLNLHFTLFMIVLWMSCMGVLHITGKVLCVVSSQRLHVKVQSTTNGVLVLVPRIRDMYKNT